MGKQYASQKPVIRHKKPIRTGPSAPFAVLRPIPPSADPMPEMEQRVMCPDRECFGAPDDPESYLGDAEGRDVFNLHREQDARWY